MRDLRHAKEEYRKGDTQYCQNELKIIEKIIKIFEALLLEENEEEIIPLKKELVALEIEFLGTRELIKGYDVKAEDFPIIVDNVVLQNRSDLKEAFENWVNTPKLIKALNDSLMAALKMREVRNYS